MLYTRLVLITSLFVLGCNGASSDDDDDDSDGDSDGDESSASDTSGTAGGSNAVGDACESPADCASGLDQCNDDPGGQCTAECVVQADCDGIPDAVCQEKGDPADPSHCYLECTSKADCPRDGYDCVGGPNAAGKMWCDPNGVGGACTTVVDCAPGLDQCNDDPGGQCTKECVVTADCAGIEDAVCQEKGDPADPSHCYKACTSKDDCPRDGYDCVGGPNPSGEMWCDVNGVGGACTTPVDCAPGLDQCNDDPGGQCTKECVVTADCADIEDAVCQEKGDPADPSHCYKACTSKDDCPRDGYDCVGGPNPSGEMWCDVIE